MALPFYVIAASNAGLDLPSVGTLLVAQTAGALASNPVWGRFGDTMGKPDLLGMFAILRRIPPAFALLLAAYGAGTFGYSFLFYCDWRNDEWRDYRISRPTTAARPTPPGSAFRRASRPFTPARGRAGQHYSP